MRPFPSRLLIFIAAVAGFACSDVPTARNNSGACDTSVGRIEIGTVVTGTLSKASCRLPDKSYADRWQFVVDSSVTVTITLASDAFDSFLIVRDEGQVELASDDDSGGGLDALITYTFAPGTYSILANSYDASATGAYRLSVVGESLACSTTVGSIAVGDTVSGVITNDSCRLSDNTGADRWQFNLAATATVTIDLASDEFDSYLILRDEAGLLLASDDDSGGGLNARITYTFPAGNYIIVANVYDALGAGAYTLSIQ
jgi:serine protease Do